MTQKQHITLDNRCGYGKIKEWKGDKDEKFFLTIILFLLLAPVSFSQDAVIEAENKPLHKINKFIYGNFVELLGGVTDGGYGAAWDDKKDDFRADVMQKFKELSIPILRFPGGCFSDTYHWKDGIGERSKRKILPNLHWGGTENNKVGTDEFLQMCKELNIEPYITVNFGTGTPEEAAEWVAYVKKKGYNVKYWEIGNEIYGGWEKGSTTAYDYAKRYLKFAKAMKNVDKNIKLIAVADATPYLGQRWNKKLLQIAGDEIDFLDLHFYPPGVTTALKGEALYYLVQSQPDVVAGIVSQVKQAIDASGKKHIKIAVAEWNVGGVPDALEERLTSGIFAGSLLNWFQRMGDFVEIGNFAQLVNTNWSITAVKVNKKKSYGTAPYYALKMYTEHTGENALPVSVKSGTFRVGAAELMLLDAVASMDKAKLYVHVVNRHIKDSITATLHLGNFSVKKDAAVYLLTADSVDAINTFEEPEKIKIQTEAIHNAGTNFSHTFPAHSVTVIEFALGK